MSTCECLVVSDNYAIISLTERGFQRSLHTPGHWVCYSLCSRPISESNEEHEVLTSEASSDSLVDG